MLAAVQIVNFGLHILHLAVFKARYDYLASLFHVPLVLPLGSLALLNEFLQILRECPRHSLLDLCLNPFLEWIYQLIVDADQLIQFCHDYLGLEVCAIWALAMDNIKYLVSLWR